MAEINTRKRGNTWEYRFEAAKVDGKRKQITKGGFKTKKEALEAGSKAYSEYNDSGLHFTPSEISFSDYLQYWLNEYCKINLSQTTYNNYSKKIRLYIQPELGIYKLRNLSPAILQELINKRFNDGLSRNTLAVIKGILSGSLKYAVEPLQFIKVNPMIAVKLPSPRAKSNIPTRKKNRRSVTTEEWKTIINRFPEGHTNHIPLQLAYRCGLRLGEVYALTWNDIDFENSTLTVSHQVQNLDNYWTLLPPKYNSYRCIQIDSVMLKLLKNEHLHQKKAKVFYGNQYMNMYINNMNQINTEEGKIINLVMTREDGTYIQPRTTQHIGRVIHLELNLKEWDFHSLRHTHTTMLIEQGISPVVVQKRLGHKNIETTLGIYAECTKKMEDQMIESLEKVLGN